MKDHWTPPNSTGSNISTENTQLHTKSPKWRAKSPEALFPCGGPIKQTPNICSTLGCCGAVIPLCLHSPRFVRDCVQWLPGVCTPLSAGCMERRQLVSLVSQVHRLRGMALKEKFLGGSPKPEANLDDKMLDCELML